MSLSREEFWVLDVLTQMNCRLTLATMERSDADLIFNKRKPLGLSRADFVDLFVTMQSKGDVVLFQHEKGSFPRFDRIKDESLRIPGTRKVIDYSPVWQNPVFYSAKEIRNDLSEVDGFRKKYQRENVQFRWEVFPKDEQRLYCCATLQGAMKWEKTAQVDWSKYLEASGGWVEDADLAENQSLMVYRAASPSKRTLDAWFEWKLRWDAHRDSFECSSFKRFHTERIHPWRATYWKTFSEGFECDYLEYSVHRSEGMEKPENDRYQIFFQESWEENHALFDWCNNYVRDFPFPGD